MTPSTRNHPEIKICGLTKIDQAKATADMGADAIGFVFFRKSPRNLEPETARLIAKELPSHVARVGVFVNEAFDAIMAHVAHVGLSAVQLHGQESPILVKELLEQNLTVIKGFYMEQEPLLSDAPRYKASAALVECKKGVLPGGNAMTWNWGAAKEFGESHPLILAGGLAPDNVEEAILKADPDAVDVSSGVESAPGEKDILKIKLFIERVKNIRGERLPDRRILRRIFS